MSVMVERIAGGKRLPMEVLEQILAKTDGVPLFVEELTSRCSNRAFLGMWAIASSFRIGFRRWPFRRACTIR